MPITPTYPGIYIQEAPSPSHTVIPASTNIAVFIGYTHPLKTDQSLFGQATPIFGFMDYQRKFGGYVRSAAFANQANDLGNADNNVGDMAVAVSQFFLNGGTTAYVVALQASPDISPPGPLAGGTLAVGGVSFVQKEITDQIYNLKVQIVPIGTAGVLADVIITYTAANPALASLTPPVQVETYRQVNLTPNDPNNIAARINAASSLVSIPTTATLPTSFTADPPQTFPTLLDQNATFFNPANFTAVLQQDTSLDKVPVINLMVLPGVTESLVISTAITFCERKLAFLVLDPKITDSADGMVAGFPDLVQTTVGGPSQPRSKNAALYFPYLLPTDPTSGSMKNIVTGKPYEIPPAATVAGIY